jgi:hypothetical protein
VSEPLGAAGFTTGGVTPVLQLALICRGSLKLHLCDAGTRPRARPHCRFRNRGTVKFES